MAPIELLQPYIFDHVASFLPYEEDDSFATRGNIRKSDLDGGVPRGIISLSSCSTRLRKVLFSTVFRTLKLGEVERTMEYKNRLSWSIESGGNVFKAARHVVIRYFQPDAFVLAAQCLSRMRNLVKYSHDSTLTIPRIFLPILERLPRLRLLSLRESGVESLPILDKVATKLSSLELMISRHAIADADCLPWCPRTISTLNKGPIDPDYAHGPTKAAFDDALTENLARFICSSSDHIETLWLDIMRSQWNQYYPNWFSLVLDRANALSQTQVSFPRLKRLLVENSCFESSHLRQLLATAPYLTHLSIFGIRKSEFDVVVRKQPMLKRLSLFFTQVPKTLPKFLSSIIDGAEIEHLYFNGLAPLDLRDLLAESTFCSALSLRTLKAIFGDPFPLRPYHFNSLVKLCVNLEEIIVSGEWQGEPTEFFRTFAQLPRLSLLDFTHPWDTRITDYLPLFAHDGRYIRTEEAGNFRVISCIGTSWNQEVRNRIRSDVDGCRPLYIERFAEVALAQPSLRTLVWKPTVELEWVWTFDRKAEKGELLMTDEARISYDKGSDTVGAPGVLMGM